ncbi:cysteine dioxygenase type 1-like isoform X1 [Branchiostoma lanceolatum]|uniref:cysteine dioxygenase type 1-like isoform X1 n=1 Tax=Branchiostoma lanceolatum TaxID=7740 RepID=UPI0034518253
MAGMDVEMRGNAIDEMLKKKRDLNPLPEPETLDDLVQGLKIIFQDNEINVEEVNEYMSKYKTNAREWYKYAKFDHHRYTRNLVDQGNGKFNLIVLCWGEGQGSGIHSHSDSHCFMKVLDGTLDETMYSWPSDSEDECELQKTETHSYGKDSVAYINDSMGLHRVENSSHTNTAVSLHLYSPPFDMVECFDQRTGHRKKVRVTFYSKFGQRTPFPDQGPTCTEQADVARTGCTSVETLEPENN